MTTQRSATVHFTYQLYQDLAQSLFDSLASLNLNHRLAPTSPAPPAHPGCLVIGPRR
jgi:hypothetical protein